MKHPRRNLFYRKIIIGVASHNKKNRHQQMKKKILIAGFGVLIALGSFGFTYRSDFFEIAKQIEIFTNLYKEVNMNYVDKINPSELMNTAIVSMLKDLDPYTQFYSEQDVQQARIQQSGSMSSIGADFKLIENTVVISNLRQNGPADSAGLKIGDQIIQIDGVRISEFQQDASELLRGGAGTLVEIHYLREGKEDKIKVERSTETQKAVPFYTLLEDKTAYIALSQFTRTASKEVGEALKELKEEGAEQLILDLRNNPGGLLGEAVNVTNLFVPKDVLITFTKSAIEKYNQTYVTQNRPIDDEIPIAVLINERSASASEIVSGSIQDLDRGIVIGARSFGKGLVQRPKNLNYGTSAKITISRYYTPSGRCIQALDYKDGEAVRKDETKYQAFKTKNGRIVYDGGGIQPDVEIESAQTEGLTKALLEQELIFKFATHYYYNNTIEELTDFKLSNQDYKDFVKFVKASDFAYKTATEQQLQELIESASDENLKNLLEKDILAIEKSIDLYKDQSFKEKKNAIERLIEEEIIRRYFFDEGVFQYGAKNAEEVVEAKAILKDSSKYKKILQP